MDDQKPPPLYCPTCEPQAPLGTPRNNDGERWHAPCYKCGKSYQLEKLETHETGFKVIGPLGG